MLVPRLRRWPNIKTSSFQRVVFELLAQRLRRWPNIKTSSFQRVVFAGITAKIVTNADHNIATHIE